MVQIIEKMKQYFPCLPALAHYFDADEDDTTKDVVLVMEYIHATSIKTYVEEYGTFEIDSVRNITYQILLVLKDLAKIDCYHGRLNISNIHLDDKGRVKLTDYWYMSIIDSESDFTVEEGSRLDIFWLGICILKMVGVLHVTEGNDGNQDSFYLENMESIKKSYRSVSS